MSLADILKTFEDETVPVLQGPRYIEKDVDGISLKGVLQRGRIKLKRAAEKKPIRMGVNFTPSSITFGFCERRKIGQLAGLTDMHYKVATPRQQTLMDFGNLAHELVQGWFWDMGILKGTYHCVKCGKNYDNLVSPESCPSGKKTHEKKHLQYREVKAKNEDYKLSGRADGICIIEGEEHLMDIKSISNRGETPNAYQYTFEDVKEQGPKEAHIVQIILYMFILGIRKGHLLYIARNTGQILTYAIPYEHEKIEPYLNNISRLMDLAQALQDGTLKPEELPKPCGDDDCLCHTILANKRD